MQMEQVNALPGSALGRGSWGMPRRPELATDPSTRTMVRTAQAKRFPFPVPNGWFIVATAEELPSGTPEAVHLFGRDLVLFRGEDGTPHVLDAYCAHLGAHLAVGGRIEGDCLRCPFHGWAYDGTTGTVTDIPYYETERIPSQAKVGAYPTIERNGMVWAWYHAQGGEPFYEVPEVPEFSDPEWTTPVVRAFEIATSCQEMAENNHDPVHFRYVHGTDAIPEDDMVVDGVYKRATGMGGNFVRETFGLGLGVIRTKGWSTFMSSTTPIDDEHVLVRWIFTTPKDGPSSPDEVADLFLSGVSQDIPIWENKVYVERPVLVKQERTILDHRTWAKQFYS
jgi:nitrite reductase/ring-hydroxylating ferredoxin subunit